MEAVETAAATASVTRIEVKNGIYQQHFRSPLLLLLDCKFLTRIFYLTEIRHSTKVPHGQKSH